MKGDLLKFSKKFLKLYNISKILISLLKLWYMYLSIKTLLTTYNNMYAVLLRGVLVTKGVIEWKWPI
jgi:hypothetical protein